MLLTFRSTTDLGSATTQVSMQLDVQSEPTSSENEEGDDSDAHSLELGSDTPERDCGNDFMSSCYVAISCDSDDAAIASPTLLAPPASDDSASVAVPVIELDTALQAPTAVVPAAPPNAAIPPIAAAPPVAPGPALRMSTRKRNASSQTVLQTCYCGTAPLLKTGEFPSPEADMIECAARGCESRYVSSCI